MVSSLQIKAMEHSRAMSSLACIGLACGILACIMYENIQIVKSEAFAMRKVCMMRDFQEGRISMLRDKGDLVYPSVEQPTWRFIGKASDCLSGYLHDHAKIFGYASALQEVSAPTRIRQRLSIPDDARYYAFSYPLSPLPVSTMNISPSKGEGIVHADWAFLTIGGYMYFNEDKDLIAIRALVPVDEEEAPLYFTDDKEWRHEWTYAYQQNWTDLLHPVTLPALRKHFEFFMWHPQHVPFPTEGYKLEQRIETANIFKAMKLRLNRYRHDQPSNIQPDCPHGCFMYFSHHPNLMIGKEKERRYMVSSLRMLTDSDA